MNQIKRAVVAIAEYYGQALTENQVRMYSDVLSVLTIEQLNFAIKRVQLDTKINRMPLPAVLITLATGASENEDDKARSIAANILSSVSRFGWNNADKARDYLGEQVWQIVNLQGGWLNLCELITQNNFTSMQAQLRDLARSVIRRGFTGEKETKKISFKELRQRIEQIKK